MSSRLATNLLDLVGNTPLVELTSVRESRIFAKLEGQNPTGSIKDRIAKAMIDATEERKRLLRLYGARIVYSRPDEGSNGAVRLALKLAEQDSRYFMPFQYANKANPRAHYEGTGNEIVEALDRVDVLVAGLGTGG